MRNSLFYRLWDGVVVVCGYIYALILPASLVTSISQSDAYFWLIAGISAIYFFDAAERIVNHHRLLHVSDVERRSPASNNPYAWFVVDVVSAIPFAFFPVTPLLRLLPLIKLLRVRQLMQFWLQREVHLASIYRLGFFVFWLSLISHVFACGWILIRGREHFTDDWSMYINALYWSMQTLSTVGYGDITPKTTAQQLYAIFCLVTGVGIYGYIIGNVTAIVGRIDPAKANYLETMERLSVFLHYHKIPAPLQKRARDYYAYLWDKRLGYSEADAVESLPESLRIEISLYIKRDIIEAVPIFKGAGEQFIRDIALHLQPMTFLPGDYIVRAGDMGQAMYFVSQGTLEVLSREEDVLATITTGDFFGEIALFLNQPRNASVRASSYCDIYRLDKDAFDRILSLHPAVAEQIREKMHGRIRG